jgi:hypothetical protein
MNIKAGRFPIVVSSAVLVAALAGCNRSNQKATPVGELETQKAPQATNKPVTLTGCLRGGDAEDTFVLTTSATADGNAPATYQLAGVKGVNLHDQIGKRVEVSGVVRAQQETESQGRGPAANKPTGTSGKPEVETRTQVDIKRLDVSNVKPLGDHCDR